MPKSMHANSEILTAPTESQICNADLLYYRLWLRKTKLLLFIVEKAR